MPFITSIRRNHLPEVKPSQNHLEIEGGDEIYTAGGYKIHVFTDPGEAEFAIRNAGNNNTMALQSSTMQAEYMVIAGGGSGGPNLSGGGGAGGYRAGTLSLGVGDYPVVVGSGGAPETSRNTSPGGGNPGDNSTFASITSTGGGAGQTGSGENTPAWNARRDGGSGGGAGGYGSGSNVAGSGISGQGFPGASRGSPGNYPGGGGGGAGSASTRLQPLTESRGCDGGTGVQNAILGTSYVWAGGGGGGAYTSPRGAGFGGLGGGGGGGTNVGSVGPGGGNALNPGTPGSQGPTSGNSNARGGDAGANTGGGGGGTGHNNMISGAGGSGIVVVRYLT